MKVLLDIRDDKASFVMELLKHLRFVKATPLGAQFPIPDRRAHPDHAILRASYN